ncbi:seipin [Anaeramoeba flamelloides]|uniref:Seipin n=1 Tax=Anaeramoeba flamelloides TaxID=1746091 RepID=A0AAV7ZVF0_9EUKA|nr:seipin [Anaeramoeba flamelloides]
MISGLRSFVSNLIFCWFKRIGFVLGHACGIMFLSGLVILTSIGSYFLFYNFYIPPSQISSSTEISPSPENKNIYFSQVELSENSSVMGKYSSERVLKGNQKYTIYLELSIHDTPSSFQQKRIDVVSKITSNQKDLFTISKPIYIQPRNVFSKIIRFAIFQFPSQIHLQLPYLPNFLKDNRKIYIECFENYEEQKEHPLTKIEFSLSNLEVPIQYATVVIKAQYVGLRHFFHDWFFTAAFLGIFISFIIQFFFAILFYIAFWIFIRRIFNKIVNNNVNNGEYNHRNIKYLKKKSNINKMNSNNYSNFSNYEEIEEISSSDEWEENYSNYENLKKKSNSLLTNNVSQNIENQDRNEKKKSLTSQNEEDQNDAIIEIPKML